MQDINLKVALYGDDSYNLIIKYMEKEFSMLLLKYSNVDAMIIAGSYTNYFETLQGLTEDFIGFSRELRTPAPFAMCVFSELQGTTHKPFLSNLLFSSKLPVIHFLQKMLITSSTMYKVFLPITCADQEQSFIKTYAKDNCYVLTAFPYTHAHAHVFHIPGCFWDKMNEYTYWPHLFSSSYKDVDQRKFCCWYCPNLLYPYNIQLYRHLNRYKKIHVYGHSVMATHQNESVYGMNAGNLSDQDATKLFELYKQYKFVLCTESCQQAGVISSHISIALAAGAVPLYYGAPDIEKYFSTARCIDYYQSGGTCKAFREALKEADQAPTRYADILRQPIFTKDNLSVQDKLEEDFVAFIKNFCKKIKDGKSKQRSE